MYIIISCSTHKGSFHAGGHRFRLIVHHDGAIDAAEQQQLLIRWESHAACVRRQRYRDHGDPLQLVLPRHLVSTPLHRDLSLRLTLQTCLFLTECDLRFDLYRRREYAVNTQQLPSSRLSVLPNGWRCRHMHRTWYTVDRTRYVCSIATLISFWKFHLLYMYIDRLTFRWYNNWFARP